MSSVEHIQRVAAALHAKTVLMGETVPLSVVELIVCDAHLIFVDNMPVELWEQ